MRDRRRALTVALLVGSVCAAAALITSRGGMAVIAAVTAAGGAVFLVTYIAVVLRHVRLSRALRRASQVVYLDGMMVRLGSMPGAAVVAGLGRPQIYLDQGLPQQLSQAELRAVTLHERAHQAARDPLRLAALSACGPLAAVVPGGRRILERAVARREIAADRFALRAGASRSALASALLRVDSSVQALPGFSSAVDLRLRALLGQEPAPVRRSRARTWLVLAASAGLAVCMVTAGTHGLAAVLHACCP